MSETERPTVYIEALCRFFAPSPNWWYEASVEDGGTEGGEGGFSRDPGAVVIHPDGMFAEMDDAITAGRAWATENGYAVREIEHDEGEDDDR